jgi:hypothetical protein
VDIGLQNQIVAFLTKLDFDFKSWVVLDNIVVII